eukprot:TRINITY_DN12549_c0_g2_i1.p1 TRINITY_DN12549_c0_g2~~TRINITY_DN12549_c0_g2_i1.p1  ORF type:complete len:952 (+),score=257.98 TRINITY_DN12549_c0_g2_i1:349-2856(+)
MDPQFEEVSKCELEEVEAKIKTLTEEHAKGEDFISTSPIYVKVTRQHGPQLSLIDLPGITHNSDQMPDIHEVTVRMVEEQMKHKSTVILCVLPAMSDFGNAEVIKLARRHDPDGLRTLGVITKCDDAARAEASDVVERALMRRDSDTRLKMGFHCVVNKSQKNVEEGMSRQELLAKEKQVFEDSERFRVLPRENWGTERLMEKIAAVQANRVDECMPTIKEAVRSKITELREEVRALPSQLETDADKFRHLNEVIRDISQDLEARVRAEFISSNPDDRDLAIAPRVADMVRDFRQSLLDRNPNWLGEDMIEDVKDAVDNFVHGYTVDNLTGSQVFVNFIKRVFVQDGLLADASQDLVQEIARHLRHVVKHIILDRATHDQSVLANCLTERALDVIEDRLQYSETLCMALAEAQQVTSTAHGRYMVKLSEFRKSWLTRKFEVVATMLGSNGQSDCQEANEDLELELPREFLQLAEQVSNDPQYLSVLEVCASLHVYTRLLIEGFVDMASKLIKYNMVEALTSKLEAKWREDVDSARLEVLFPVNLALVEHRKDLEQKLQKLQEFRENLATLKLCTPLPCAPAAFARRMPTGKQLENAPRFGARAERSEAKRSSQGSRELLTRAGEQQSGAHLHSLEASFQPAAVKESAVPLRDSQQNQQQQDREGQQLRQALQEPTPAPAPVPLAIAEEQRLQQQKAAAEAAEAQQVQRAAAEAAEAQQRLQQQQQKAAAEAAEAQQVQRAAAEAAEAQQRLQQQQQKAAAEAAEAQQKQRAAAEAAESQQRLQQQQQKAAAEAAEAQQRLQQQQQKAAAEAAETLKQQRAAAAAYEQRLHRRLQQ